MITVNDLVFRWPRALLVVFALLTLATPPPATAAVLLTVEGVSGKLRENVLRALTLHRDRGEALPEATVRRLHAAAADEIQRALQPFGYYRARVDGSLERVDADWRARYVVTPGPPLLVRQVDVVIAGDGAGDPEFQRLRQTFPLQAGDALDQPAYEEAKRTFLKTAIERGYFDVQFTAHELRLDLTAYYADVRLHLDTGVRYRFGEVSFEQDQAILSDALLARYLQLRDGDPYANTALLGLQRALLDSEYYSEVEITADPRQARDYTIPVRVRLTARKPSRYTVGLGYGTDTGARGSLGWERRYLNPQGHHLRAETRWSQIEKNLSASYLIPINNPRSDQLAFTATYNEGDTRTADTLLRRLAVSRSVARGNWREILSLNLQSEQFLVGGDSGTAQLLMPDAQWSRSWGESRVYTREGARLVLGVRGAAEALGSDTDFLQSRVATKWITDIGDSGRVIVRGDVGASRVDEFRNIPPSIRFFAGGDRSVRGYAFNTLGPENARGQVIGGRHLLVGSVEYEHVVYGNWALAAFYDAGNALDRFGDALKRGAGIGVRWKSPIGQVRVDIAQALDEPDRPWRLHFNVGPDL